MMVTPVLFLALNRSMQIHRPQFHHSVISGLLIGMTGLPLLITASEVVDLGSRRELFVDRFLIDSMRGVELRLQEPRDEGTVLRFDEPWERIHCGYSTVIRDGDPFRLYYRGMPADVMDGTAGEVTCVAESNDGLRWMKPKLGLFDVRGRRKTTS